MYESKNRRLLVSVCPTLERSLPGRGRTHSATGLHPQGHPRTYSLGAAERTRPGPALERVPYRTSVRWQSSCPLSKGVPRKAAVWVPLTREGEALCPLFVCPDERRSWARLTQTAASAHTESPAARPLRSARRLPRAPERHAPSDRRRRFGWRALSPTPDESRPRNTRRFWFARR